MSNLDYLQSVSSVLAQGLLVTVKATALGMTLATTLGLVVAVLRLLRIPVLSHVLEVLVMAVRNTPLLVQLYLLYYVLPVYGITLSAFQVGVIGLGVHFSAYTAEVYRAGFENVPKGQWEAARALNLSLFDTIGRVIFPQALRPVIPALGNYLISMFKDSAIIATVTVMELLGTTQQLASESFRYTLLFTTMGIIYFAISYPSSLAVRWLESRMGRLS